MTPFARNRGRSFSLPLIALAVAGGIVTGAPAPAWAGWSTPVQLPPACAPPGNGLGQNLALNGNGLWAIATAQMAGVTVCTSSDGVNWTGPTVIGQGFEPAVAVAPNGKIVVVWQGGTGT